MPSNAQNLSACSLAHYILLCPSNILITFPSINSTKYISERLSYSAMLIFSAGTSAPAMDVLVHREHKVKKGDRVYQEILLDDEQGFPQPLITEIVDKHVLIMHFATFVYYAIQI